MDYLELAVTVSCVIGIAYVIAMIVSVRRVMKE